MTINVFLFFVVSDIGTNEKKVIVYYAIYLLLIDLRNIFFFSYVLISTLVTI